MTPHHPLTREARAERFPEPASQAECALMLGLLTLDEADVVRSHFGALEPSVALATKRARSMFRFSSGHETELETARHAVEIVRLGYRELTSVKLLAQRLRCHPVYLARAFGHACQMDVSDFLRCFRVGTALAYLLSTQIKITAIAYLVGFNCKSSFFRSVQRLTRQSPGHWRSTGRTNGAVGRFARPSTASELSLGLAPTSAAGLLDPIRTRHRGMEKTLFPGLF